MEDVFKTTRKDQIFEKLIKEIKPISRKYSHRFDYGTGSKAKGSTNHTIEFDMNGYDVKIESKDKK